MPKLNPTVTRQKRGASSTWIARVRWIDAAGVQRNKQRTARTKAEAKTELERLIAEQSEAPADSKPLTLDWLAVEFSAKKLIPAEYRGNTKIKGMRSHARQRQYLKVIRDRFGVRPIGSITYEDLVEYRQFRHETPKRNGEPRSVSQVNKELSLLRSMFRFAIRSGYLAKSPFESGDSLINLADEVERDRLLTREEEAKLLSLCTGRRAYLGTIIMIAVDTALRKGEILQLRWSDVSIEAGLIQVRSTTTKTRRARSVGMTARVRAALSQRIDAARRRKGFSEEELIFGGVKDIKKPFDTCREKAKIENLVFHDLRHTATTRMIEAGMAPGQVMKITGHSQWKTFARYLNVNDDTARQAAGFLDALNKRDSKVLVDFQVDKKIG